MELLLHADIPTLVQTVGLLGLFLIVFAESGLLIGFFLPGDSLLFTAGFLASQGYFNIMVLILGCLLAAVAGDSVGYAFGKKLGPKIFTREDSLFFHKDHLMRARAFYERHGGMTIILARFLPVIRTFAPILAGVGEMRYPIFLSYNVIGGALWAVGLPLIGFFLGNTVPNIDRYLVPIILLIISISLIPPAIHFFRNREDRERMFRLIKSLFRR